MTRRRLFAFWAFTAVAYAAVLLSAFMMVALDALLGLPKVVAGRIPIAEMGVAIGAVLAGLGVLIASVRYLLIPRISEVWPQNPSEGRDHGAQRPVPARVSV